jgi:hypothetical protein
MILELLRHLLLIAGAATAVVAVVGIWSILLHEVWADAVKLNQHYIQSRRDTKLFHNVEEFRRDFS